HRLSFFPDGLEVVRCKSLIHEVKRLSHLDRVCIDVLVADARGSVDAVDQDVGSMFAHRVDQHRALVRRVDRAEQVFVVSSPAAGATNEIGSVFAREFGPDEEIPPQLVDFDRGEFFSEVAGELSHFLLEERCDDDFSWAKVVGGLVSYLGAYESRTAEYQNGVVYLVRQIALESVRRSRRAVLCRRCRTCDQPFDQSPTRTQIPRTLQGRCPPPPRLSDAPVRCRPTRSSRNPCTHDTRIPRTRNTGNRLRLKAR